MTLIERAASGVRWKSAATALRVIVQFGTVVVLARLLPPTDFGLMGMATVVTGFAMAFADFGIGNAIVHRHDATREQLSSLYWLNVAVGWGLFALIWLGTPLAVAFYRDADLTPVLRWSAVAFLIIPFGQQFEAVLRREIRFRDLGLVEIASHVANAVVAIGMAFAGRGVMSLVWGLLARSGVYTAGLVLVAAREKWWPMLRFRRSDLAGFVSFGLYQMGERALDYFSANVDYLVIGRYLGTGPLGYYTLAYKLASLPLHYVNPVITSVAFPLFARVQHDDAALRRGYQKVLYFVSSVTFPMLAGLFVTAPAFVEVAYGATWAPTVPVVKVLCILLALHTLGNPIGSLLLAKGRADLGFWMSTVGVLGRIVATLVGVRWGILGVAVGVAAFDFAVLLPLDILVRRRLIGMTVREFWSAFSSPLYSSLAMVVVLGIVQVAWLLGHPGLVLGRDVLVGALVYGAMIWFLARDSLSEAWRLLRGRAPVRAALTRAPGFAGREFSNDDPGR